MLQSFSAILSSLQDGKARGADKASVEPVNPTETKTGSMAQHTTTSIVNRKRKPEDDAAGARKVVKLTETTTNQDSRMPGLIKSAQPTRSHVQTAKPAYLGGSMKSKIITAAPVSQSQPAKLSPQNGAPKTLSAPKSQQNHTATAPPAAKRGFASLLAKANAAQEAVKAAGPDIIKHKVTEVMKKKERERLKQQAKNKEIEGRKGLAATSNTACSSKATIGQSIRRPKDDLSKVGTMRAKPARIPTQKHKQKGLGQDRYGGYASWSDLSGAEEDLAEDYESESESDMEEAGFDDVMEEEQRAARIAREEDQRELQDEERRRKEKLARQKKLLALSNSAAAAKKRY